MERIYYNINEGVARRAHEMKSFSDYKSGSATAGYRELVDRCYTLADKVAAARPKDSDKVYNLAERYSKRMAIYYNKDAEISLRCPSVMIAGPANFPTRKKQKQVAAWDKNLEFYNETQKILDKLKSMYYGKDIIKSGDDDAIERLKDKLDTLKLNQEHMKAVNKAVRLKDVEKGNETLKALGLSNDQIKELRTPDYAGRQGYPSWALSNNNANIHRVEKRLEELETAKAAGNVNMENEYFKVVENTEIMRLQLIFDGKPDADVREILKSNGFRWSPSNKAWQRQLTNNARYALERVTKEIGAL